MRTRFTVGAIVGLLLVGCASSPAPSQSVALQKISVILDWSPNTNHSGLYLAQARGYYAAAGLDVTFIEPGDTSGLTLLGAGQADFALSVAESLLPARAQGVPVVSVAAIVQHNTSSLVSLTESRITRPKDLEGKIYGGYDGQLEKALISALVACDGGDPSKVTFGPLPSDDFRIGLTEGSYDAAWIFNAWDGIRLEQVDNLPVSTIDFLDHIDCIPDWYTPLIATTESAIASNPDRVSSFLQATAKGYADAMNDPKAAAAALMSAAPELDADLVTLSADYLSSRYAVTPAQWGAQQESVWNAFATFLIDNELLPEDFQIGAAWNGELL